MKRIIIRGLLIGLIASVQGQTEVTLRDDTIVLGEQTVLTISNAADYPSAELLTANGIEALGQSFDSTGTEQMTVVTSFEPGDHYIHVGDDSLLLVVLDVEVDTTADIHDIGPIKRVPYTFWEIFRWVLLALAIAAIAVLVYWLLKHRKKIHQVFAPQSAPDNRTAEERALDALETLRRSQLWQAGKAKEYHTELTDIVRQFIEETTGIRATDMTSNETIDAVCGGEWTAGGRRGPIPSSLHSQLSSIFGIADMVKFAKSEPLPHEHERSMSEAVAFVKELWDCAHAADSKDAEAGNGRKEEKDA